jgi:3-hydroxyacyl-[acyl-carrier-protein] dehydratase
MKFHLVDRIESIEPGKRIVAVKALSLAEEYLADHFPAFPVMPGVLMLEGLVQTAAWLVRLQQNWSKSLIELAAARNIRYGNFVAPGRVLRMEAELLGLEGDLARFKGAGTLEDGQQAVSGRLELRCFNVADFCPQAAGADERIIARLKERFRLIGGAEALAAAARTPSSAPG